MKYEDPQMEEYYRSLPPAVRQLIDRSGADICSPGELTLIGEHFRHSLPGSGDRDGTSPAQQPGVC